jgi:predicted deacylase
LENDAPRAVELVLDTVEPGQWHRVWIDLLEGRSPGLGSVPVQVLRAPDAGPTLGVVAVVHGDEVNGTAVIHSLLRTLGTELGRGALVVVPVINVSGLLRNARTFFDGKDLNRSMHGPEDGRPSQRFGWRFIDRLVARFDWIVDLHTATRGYANSIYARADMTDARVARLARTLAPTILVHKVAPSGSIRRAAASRGIPAVAVEIGDPSCLQDESVALVRDGVLRVLEDLRMIRAGSVEEGRRSIECTQSRWLRAPAPGLATGIVDPGSQVTEGSIVASVADVWGDVIGTVRAPENGIVLGALRRPFVVEGTRVVHLATLR